MAPAMNGRSLTGLALRLAAVAFALGTTAAAILAWRLTRGPIDLPFLTPILERALSGAGGTLTVRIRTTTLAWDARDRHVELRLLDAEARGDDDDEVATIPALAIRLNRSALLRGAIVPREVTLLGPRLRLVRQLDGQFGVGIGDVAGVESEEILPLLADGLFGARAVGGSSVRLRVFEVRDGDLALVDRASGHVSHVTGVTLVLRPDGDGLAGHGTGQLEAGKEPVTLVAAYRRPPGTLDLRLAVRDLDLPAAATLLPAPEIAARAVDVQLPVDAHARLALDDALRLRRARVKATGGPGQLALSGLLPDPLPVRRLALAFDVDRGADALRLDGLTVDLAGPRLRLRGQLAPLRGSGTVEAHATVTRLPVARLAPWWPPTTAPEARQWVTNNVVAGAIHELDLQVVGTMTDADPTTFVPATVAGSLAFAGLSARYLPPMSPLVGAAGTGTFSHQAFDLRVARGTVAGLELVHGSVRVPLDARPGGRIAVQAAVRGPLARALALVDEPPLALAGTLGVPLAGVGGTMSGSIGLSVPLAGTVTWPALAPTVSVDMRDVTVPRVLRDLAVTTGRLALRLDARALQLTGDARLQDVPFTVDWNEELIGTTPRRHVQVSARAAAGAFAALADRPLDWVDGPLAVTAQYAGSRTGSGTVAVDVDLAAARLDAPALNLRKAAGEPGRARADLVFAGGVLRTVDPCSLTTATATVTGSATRTPAGTRWQTIDARAIVGGPTPAHVTVAVRPAGTASRLTVTSDDAGGLFRALGSYDDARGGRLGADGLIDLAATKASFDGHVEVREFTLTRSPWLAQLAAATSLSGITSGLTGKGIMFDRLTVDLLLHADVVTIRNLVAAGPSLGLSARGTIDRRAGTIAIEGSVIPAYFGLNQAAGRIPVLGDLLTGTRREGIQVMDFTVTGAPGAPKVSARTSSLAPGLARDLLRLFGR